MMRKLGWQVSALAALLVAVACGGESRSDSRDDGGAAGSDRMPVDSNSASTAGSSGAAGSPSLAGASGEGEPDSPAVKPQAATFAAVQSRILSNCSGGFFSCHGREPFDAELDLSADSAYRSLVGRSAVIDSTLLLVKAGNAEQSFLWRKLVGDLPADHSLGSRMPIESSWRPSADDLDLLRRWIDEGAKP